MDETTFIASLKKGDARAYELLYDRYWKPLYAKAMGRVRDEEAAKDVVQQLFVSIWQNREQLEITTSLEQFMLGSIKYHVFNYFRSEKAKQRILDRAAAEVRELMAETPDAETLNAMRAKLDNLLLTLPENMKRTFLLRCDNHSIKEIADELGLAEQTVSNHLHEIVSRFRKRIQRASLGEGTAIAMLLWLHAITIA